MGFLTSWPEALYRGRPVALDATAGGFSMDSARALGWASQLANETEDAAKLGRILGHWGWEIRSIFAGRIGGVLKLTSARGFVARHGGVSVVAFAGTEPTNIADWLIDFAIGVTADGVHAGFDAGVQAAWDGFAPVLTDETGPVVLTGHSLGGALAMVAAWRLIRDGVVHLDRLGGVYTFGTPRVGNERFARTARGLGLGRRTFRLVHGADIVANLPPAEAPHAFRHIGGRLSCAHGAMFRAEDLVADMPEPPPPGKVGWFGFLQAAMKGSPIRDLPGDAAAASVIDKLPPGFRDHVPDRYLWALGAL